MQRANELELERTWTDIRFEWDAATFEPGYVFLNRVQVFASDRGNEFTYIKVEARDYVTTGWSTIGEDISTFGGWPGFTTFQHASIAFNNSSPRKDVVRLSMGLNFPHASNKIEIDNIEWHGYYQHANHDLVTYWDTGRNFGVRHQLKMEEYGVGTHTGTSAYFLTTDASGNII